MPVIHTNASKMIDEFFEKITGFQREYCIHIRKLVHKALPGVREDWKWGGPNFNINGGMVCGIWSFKNHVTLNFYKGGLIKDTYKLFNDAEKTKGNRTIHFTEAMKLDDAKIIEYLKKAAEINKIGLKPQKKKIIVKVPVELAKVLDKDKTAKKYFEGLAPSHRRDYAEYISQAKQEETRIRRLDKVMKMLADKRKLNDKYL